jgi:hypothetical protein
MRLTTTVWWKLEFGDGEHPDTYSLPYSIVYTGIEGRVSDIVMIIDHN